jgi:RNA polymerase primary sigma factor
MTTPVLTSPGAAESIILYLNEIGDEPLLTFAQEQELARAILDGREASRLLSHESPMPPQERRRLEAQASAGERGRA